MASKSKDLKGQPVLPTEIVQRVKVIREQLERLQISRPGYRIDGPSQRRSHLSDRHDSDQSQDTHNVHLIPRR